MGQFDTPLPSSPNNNLIMYGLAVSYRYDIYRNTTFTKLIGSYLTDEEYRGLQGFLLGHPDAGKIVRGSGGVRKLRWSIADKGKSGGIRIIYYWKRADNEVWFLTVYGKSERETIPGHILKQIAEEINNG